MVRANAEITFCGPCGAASRKEIEFRELGRDSAGCFSAAGKKKLEAAVARPVHVNCFNRPAFSTIDGLAVRAYYNRGPPPGAKSADVGLFVFSSLSGFRVRCFLQN